MSADDSAQEFPLAFGRYELLELMAAGGMAEIFRARIRGELGFEKKVVIKRILPHLAADRSFIDMFVDEATLTARLEHPKIVQVLDFGQVEGRFFIALELVDGVDVLAVLRDVNERKTYLEPALAVHVVSDVLEALDYAHSATGEDGRNLGIVHRDVTPSNILLSRQGEVKLGDFGIARAGERRGVTAAGAVKGKYSYMSPEQAMGEDVDGRSDIFAAGIVLAEILTGRRLFAGRSDLDILLAVRDARIDRFDQFGGHVAPVLQAIVRRALSRQAADRYQTADQFLEALTAAGASLGLRAGARDVRALVQRLAAPAPPTAPPPQVQPKSGSAKEFIPAPSRPRSAPIAVSETSSGSLRVTAATATGSISRITATPGGHLTEERISRAGSVPSAVEAPTLVSPEDIIRQRMTMSELSTGVIRSATRTGELQHESLVRVLFQVGVARETGLLVVGSSSVVKEIFVGDGNPIFVSSNSADELFGEFLVKRKVISPGELSMALAMMGRFGGKLGDTLVALSLLKPVEVLRQITQQVRHKIFDLFSWPRGVFVYFRGQRPKAETSPLGLEVMEVIASGVRGMPREHVFARLDALAGERLRLRDSLPVSLSRFRLGPTLEDTAAAFDGRRTVAEVRSYLGGDNGPAVYSRSIYLLHECELIAPRG